MKRILLIALLFTTMISYAQEVTFWEKVNGMLIRQANVDTNFIYQPKAGFSLGLFTTGQQAGFDVNVRFKTDDEEDGIVSGISEYSISENLCKKIGLEVGYGKVVLGYGMEVGVRSAYKKNSFALNVLGRAWGVHFNYFKISNQFNTSITIEDQNEEILWHDDLIIDELASLQSLTVDGYYVFNNKRLAYPAAYKVGMVQRRTAGSWMLTARYMQGKLHNTPEGALASNTVLDGFSTMQASVGGGYSANIVLWHKDPTGLRDKGLRNLTVNLTALPMLTLFNYLKTSSYKYDEDGNFIGEKKTKVLCWPMPNYIGSTAISFTWNRFFFSAQFTYNHFYFRSRDAQVRLFGV